MPYYGYEQGAQPPHINVWWDDNNTEIIGVILDPKGNIAKVVTTPPRRIGYRHPKERDNE